MKILVPSEFKLGSVGSSTCITQGVASAMCSKKDNLVILVMSSSATVQYLNGQVGEFDLNNFVQTPVNEGTYLFDIDIY